MKKLLCVLASEDSAQKEYEPTCPVRLWLEVYSAKPAKHLRKESSIQKLLLEITEKYEISISRSVPNDWSLWQNDCSSSNISGEFGQFSPKEKKIFFFLRFIQS